MISSLVVWIFNWQSAECRGFLEEFDILVFLSVLMLLLQRRAHLRLCVEIWSGMERDS